MDKIKLRSLTISRDNVNLKKGGSSNCLSAIERLWEIYKVADFNISDDKVSDFIVLSKVQ